MAAVRKAIATSSISSALATECENRNKTEKEYKRRIKNYLFKASIEELMYIKVYALFMKIFLVASSDAVGLVFPCRLLYDLNNS